MLARLALMSQSAMSTPLMALNRTGPLRQYELTYDDCQMSSISSTLRPIRKGLRYWSTAVATTWARWVKAAQPRPYRPASDVSTFTITSRMLFGAVRIVLMSVTFSAGRPRVAAGFSCAHSPAIGLRSESRLTPPTTLPALNLRSASLRSMSVSPVSEVELEAELHPARIVQLGLDLAEVGIVQVADPGIEAGPVEQVEQLPAEVEPSRLAEVERLRQRIVLAEAPGNARLWIVAGRVPQTVRRLGSEVGLGLEEA